MSTTDSRTSEGASGFFRKEREAELLAQAVGTPTGKVLTFAGVSFDLLPFDTTTGLKVLELFPKIAVLWGQMQAGIVRDTDLETIITGDLPWVLDLLRSSLRDAARMADPDFDETVFDAWYGNTRFAPLVKAVIPGVLRANGMDKLADSIEQVINRFEGADKGDPTLPPTAETTDPA